ncbi:MAG: toprim domain-containing protein [Candidatus Parvarchaeota archaeon]|nr:toprim domain-containing protein [Candidatus Jingweiarchaeum tengchongense]MCW1298409.1 toprim domain-containing protein [Candidatus Jingweiarchaeum tengchongense]MCW1300289.1 toprim domain-containing protein [Candidatus Jingweiarchaeum tengchongense]MCW1304915.1 toprim domain-containing protein [Candidatus Jingweiarchaeum tengchongense]MCW1306143.1 toprim domain-containing protein [Candidatus Jingweiarchaeum tengchongense]
MNEIETINNLIEKLIDVSKNKIVVVEGEKDKEALEKLGVFNVRSISRKSIVDFVEEIASKNKEVILLPDLDREGRKKLTQLLSAFEKEGVKVDLTFYKELSKTEIRQIEGIIKRIRNLNRGDCHGKNCSYFCKIYYTCFSAGRWGRRKARCNWSDIWSD